MCVCTYIDIRMCVRPFSDMPDYNDRNDERFALGLQASQIWLAGSLSIEGDPADQPLESKGDLYGNFLKNRVSHGTPKPTWYHVG